MNPPLLMSGGLAAICFISLWGMWESTLKENSGGLGLCAIKIIFTDEIVHLIHITIMKYSKTCFKKTEDTLLFELKYCEGKEQKYFKRILLVDFSSCSVL